MSPTTRPAALDVLSAEEHAQVLEGLLARHPDLRDEAEELATGLLADVDRSEVADRVVAVFLSQSYMDIGNRAGRQPWGYVHEADAQWELLEETMDPFTDEVERLIGLGLREEAAEQAAGIVDGLERLLDEADEETLVGCGPLKDNAAGLFEGVRITCEEAGVEPVPTFDPW